ncbi:MAG: hypothetical protein SFU86_24300 [Pirellulaceae bacterium]|nr:hypothetical protein [Pirellulaceae bacterium]
MTRAVAGVFALLSLSFVVAEEAPPPTEAIKSDGGAWTLGGQAWEFKAIESLYSPLTGAIDPKTGAAVWTLEITRELNSAEAAAQSSILDSPFRPVLLDGEKTVVATDARVKITPVSGKLGDRVRMTVQLPKAEVLGTVKTIRVERRTQLGF